MSVPDSTIETVRGWLIEERVGLIDHGELVTRVDAVIVALPEPPPDLVAVSVGESVAWSGRLDLVEYPVDDRDAARLASLMLAKFDDEALGWDAIEGIALSAAQLIPDSAGAHDRFLALSDALYLAREIGGGPAGGQDARSRLEQIAAGR